jgi:DNA polymerase elongation subunit (family B)
VRNAELRAQCDGQASHCQLEFECDASGVAAIERDAIAPLVVASFDCEMFSHDGTFPTVGKGDLTYCVCTSFRVQGNGEKCKKVAIFVGSALDRPPDGDDIIVQCVATSADVLVAWRNLMVHADPDIVLSWNGKGFDMPFLAQEHAQAQLDPLDRGSEGVHAVISRRAQELLGTWTESSRPPLISEFGKRVPRTALLNAVRDIEASFDPLKPTLVRALLSSGGGSAAGGVHRQTCLDAYYESDESGDEEGGGGFDPFYKSGAASSAATASLSEYPSWVAPLLKQSGGLLESTARRVRSILIKAASVSETSIPKSTHKLVALLKERGMEGALWDWVRTCLGNGIADMLTRPAQHVGTVCLGMMLSRASVDVCALQERQMTSAAKGDNLFSTIQMRGRAVVDLMHIIKDDKKPDSNALSFAAKKYLGGPEHDKIDMPVADIFALYTKSLQGDASAAWPVVQYCAQDAMIPLWLCEKLQYVPTWIEQSRVCYTPLDAVCNGGQQVKVFNLIARFVKGEFVINAPDSGWPVDDDVDDLGEEPSLDRLRKKASDYVGATVIPPVAGFYTDPISTLDFASLYPSIIISFNLCPSTLYRDTKESLEALQRADASITYDVHKIRHNLPHPTVKGETVEEDREYIFLTHVPSLLSRLLMHLLNTRKAVKKILATTTDASLRAVLKGRELGLKLCANSAYGFMGVSAKRGMLPCKPVAAVTTLKGRDMIEATRRHVEIAYSPAKVVYGDVSFFIPAYATGVYMWCVRIIISLSLPILPLSSLD